MVGLPTLPTLPLVFRTPVLPSVLRRVGLALVLPTLISPLPLLLFSRAGVLGRDPAGAAFSTSLSALTGQDVVVTVSHLSVMTEVVLNARRWSFIRGDRDGDRRLMLIVRISYSSSVSPSSRAGVFRVTPATTCSKGSFSSILCGDCLAVPYSLLVLRGCPGVGAGRLSSWIPMVEPALLRSFDSISPRAERLWEPFGGVKVCPLLARRCLCEDLVGVEGAISASFAFIVSSCHHSRKVAWFRWSQCCCGPTTIPGRMNRINAMISFAVKACL